MEFQGQLLLRTYQNTLSQNSFHRKRKIKTIEVKYNKITSISFIFSNNPFYTAYPEMLVKCRKNPRKRLVSSSFEVKLQNYHV